MTNFLQEDGFPLHNSYIIDENLGSSSLGVTIQPAVFKSLLQYIKDNRYVPIFRYHSVPYVSEFMLPILDVPISDSGWADLYINPHGTAKLFIAKEKTLAEWYKMMDTLKTLFYGELGKKGYHFLGLAKDKVQLNHYYALKQEILKEYYVIKNWRIE